METKRSTFATSFYIKRSAVRNRDGKAPIMVKISVDGDDKAVGTKLFVTPDLWENGKAKGKSAEANERSPPGSPTTTTASSGKRISSPPRNCATPSSVSA